MEALSCIVVGQGGLPIQCLGILADAGFIIRAVVSSDRAVREECAGRGWRTMPLSGIDWNNLAAEVAECDFLFSIVNFSILPDSVVSAPKKLAINFHDAPLPRYGGMNAAFWALWNGETEHGVTWHVMTADVDGGDILEQARVPIGPDDTSFVLNLKCSFAAIQTFRSLVEKLRRGEPRRLPQDPSRRSYFEPYARPPAAGLLDFTEPARIIARHVRAFSFGSHENRMGVARIVLGGKAVVVQKVVVTDESRNVVPGTVVRSDNRSLCIATSEGSLLATDIFDGFGRPIPDGWIPDAVRMRSDVQPSRESLDWLTAADQGWVRNERFWKKRIVDASFLELPPSMGGAESESRIEGAISVSPLTFLQQCLDHWSIRLGKERFEWGLVRRDLPAAQGDWTGLISDAVPASYVRGKALADGTWSLIEKRGFFLRDVGMRYPDVPSDSPIRGNPWPILVHWGAAGDRPCGSARVCLTIDFDRPAFTFSSSVHSIDDLRGWLPYQA